MKKMLSLLLSACCALPLFACSDQGSGTTTVSEAVNTPLQTAVTADPDPTPTDAERMLTVGKDGFIYNGLGEGVVLRGINLGGWLLQETWMCPVIGSECNSDSFALLKRRGFTEEQIQTLYMTYAEHFITEPDIKYIAALGMNCLRLPFWYRNFMNEDLQFYAENPDENPGFQLMDRLIGWAEKYGLYVILDMHGAPGGQSTDHTTGTLNKNELYTSEENLSAMQSIWEAIATRYKDNGTVCAYDIMNEPMNNNTEVENGWPAQSDIALDYTYMVYDRMYKAIRAVDRNHMISIEGIWTPYVLRNPADYGWENMLYQLHLYDKTLDMVELRVRELSEMRKNWGVAVYAGEFNNGDEFYDDALKVYRDNKINCTAWTYKVTYDYHGNWSLQRANIPPADLANDSYEEILKKWGKCLETTSSGWTANNTLKNWLKKYYQD